MLLVVKGSKNTGKTAIAEDYCKEFEGSKYFIATMRVKDSTDEDKVTRSREERADKGFVTIEQDVAIVKAIDKIKWMESLLGGGEGDKSALIASLPTLCANEMFLADGEIVPHKEVESTILCGLALLKEYFKNIVIITDENPELSHYGDSDVRKKLADNTIADDGLNEYAEAMKELNLAMKTLADKVLTTP